MNMNRKQFKLFIAASFLILAGIFCGGCTNKNAEDDVPGYTVYYLNTQGRSLVGNEYKTSETDKLLLVEELLERMRNVPSDLDCQSAIPVRVGDFTEKMERNVLYLYTDSNYALMKRSPTGSKEMFCTCTRMPIMR